jgi:hypothetical protein
VKAYRVEFHAKGDDEAYGLPKDAFVALFETLVAVSRDPWANSREDSLVGDPTYRWVPFGDGHGIVQIRVDEDKRVVRVHGVTWTG